MGVCNTPLRSSPQCYRSRVGILTIICVDTYALQADLSDTFQVSLLFILKKTKHQKASTQKIVN